MPIRLVLADDHPLILDALEQLFGLERDFEVLALCQDGAEALKALDYYQPDVLILDLRMPHKDGLAVLREMQQAQCPTRVVLLTAAIEESEVLEAMRLGVHGVVLKEMASRLLVECVRKVHAGGQWFERRSVPPAHRRPDMSAAQPCDAPRPFCPSVTAMRIDRRIEPVHVRKSRPSRVS